MCETEETQLFQKLKEFEDIFHDVESGIMSHKEGLEAIKKEIEAYERLINERKRKAKKGEQLKSAKR